jgi:hypothetical protein
MPLLLQGKKHKIANSSTTTEAREKICIDLEFLELQRQHATQSKSNQSCETQLSLKNPLSYII